MSHIRDFDGILYWPTTQHNGSSCEQCHIQLQRGKLVYQIENNNISSFICSKCLAERISIKQQVKTPKVFDFPKTAILYVGDPGKHHCHIPITSYASCIAKFRLNKQSIALPVKHCPSCNNCIIRTKLYKRHQRFFKEYQCIRIETEKAAIKQQIKTPETFEFPKTAILYVGETGGHHCHLPITSYDSCMAKFRLNKQSITLPVHHCPSCDNYIIKEKSYKKHQLLFKEYKLISIKTGKEIVRPLSTEFLLIKAPKKHIEIPSSVKQAAFRPYQGGRFSGK